MQSNAENGIKKAYIACSRYICMCMWMNAVGKQIYMHVCRCAFIQAQQKEMNNNRTVCQKCKAKKNISEPRTQTMTGIWNAVNQEKRTNDRSDDNASETTDCSVSFTLIILSSTHDKCTLPSWDTRVKCSESPISNKGLVPNKVSVEEGEVLTRPELWITRLSTCLWRWKETNVLNVEGCLLNRPRDGHDHKMNTSSMRERDGDQSIDWMRGKAGRETERYVLCLWKWCPWFHCTEGF